MCISDQWCIILQNGSIWPQSTDSKGLNAILSTPVHSGFRRRPNGEGAQASTSLSGEVIDTMGAQPDEGADATQP